MGRIFILHHYGGLYLDIDCQCYRDPIDTLTDYDFVIQGYGLPSLPARHGPAVVAECKGSCLVIEGLQQRSPWQGQQGAL